MTIELTIKNYRCFVAPATITIARNLTAFVGINNAGKSALMRFLLEFRELFEHLRYDQHILNFIHGSRQPINIRHVLDTDEVFSNLNGHGIDIAIAFTDYPRGPAIPTKVEINFGRDTRIWKLAFFSEQTEIILGPGCSIQQPGTIRENTGKSLMVSEFTSLMDYLRSTLYIGPFRNVINVGANQHYFDISVGDSFISEFQTLKAGARKKDSAAMATIVDQIKNIFEFDSLSIDASDDRHSLHITVNGKPYKQNELGSGLTQFIIVLANAAIKKPKLILIDEPELHLHPRLQLDFLTTLASYADGLWFSTHSIGLARSAADRVYTVQRRKDGDSIVRPLEGTVRLAEFLGEMSFSSYSELGFEKILLVEGPTEVKVFQQVLRAMRKDHQIVILPMYGRFPDEEELGEILRISTRVYALIDSERNAQGAPLAENRNEFLALCSRKNVSAQALELRATENYFPDEVVKNVFGNAYRALAPYERLKDANPHWGKSENWKLAAAWPLDALKATDLGKFLESL
jgi:predicted ATPase